MDLKGKDNRGLQKEHLKVSLLRCAQKLSSDANSPQTQGKILKILYLQGPMTQKTLQDKLGIQSGSMSEIAAKLERKGLLRREKDAVDKRKIHLTLTDAGRADVEQFQALGRPHLSVHFDALTQEEQETLLSLLEKLLDSWSTPEKNG